MDQLRVWFKMIVDSNFIKNQTQDGQVGHGCLTDVLPLTAQAIYQTQSAHNEQKLGPGIWIEQS